MVDFEFIGLDLEKIIAHEVYVRNIDKTFKAPFLSDQFINLDQKSKDTIQTRIVDALANKSHGIEAQVEKNEADGFFQLAASSCHADIEIFKENSRKLAIKLAEAQTSRSSPGGAAIVIRGLIAGKRFLGFIKAEADKGFDMKADKDGSLTLALIEKMLLSSAQKLFKIGFVVEINAEKPVDGLYNTSNYRVFLFDHLMTATQTKSAAGYFYQTFLGFKISESSRVKTQHFYEKTKEYINRLPIIQEDKIDYLDSLRSELRSETPTISVDDFSKKHFPEEIQDEYESFMVSQGVSENAITKDREFIKSKVRRPRDIRFSSGVSIKYPITGEEGDLVKFEPANDGYTTVKIKGTVDSTE